MAKKIFVKPFDEPEKSREKKAEELLADFRKRSDPSEVEAAIEAIYIFRSLGLPDPVWAMKRLADGAMLYRTGRVSTAIQVTDERHLPLTPAQIYPSMDEALGLKPRTYKQVAAQIKKLELARNVYRNMKILKKEGRPTDEHIFELAGENIRISGALAKQYYYDCLREGYPPILGRKKTKEA